MALTLDDYVARFATFEPSMAGWTDTAAEVPEDMLEAIGARVFDPVPVSERTASLNWRQVKKPAPWMQAWIRTFAPDAAKFDLKRCAELGESPLLHTVERLELMGSKKIDAEALTALVTGSHFKAGPLKHFGLRPHAKKSSTELGRVIAEHLGPTIESLDIDGAILEGLLDAKTDFPRLRHLRVFRKASDAARLATRLVAWPPFARLTGLSCGSDAALVEALETSDTKPPLQSLDAQGPLALALLPHLDALEELTVVGGHGILDALAEHPTIRLRSLTASDTLSDEVADYFRSSKADQLETLTIGYGTSTRRSCCEAMAASNARPTRVQLHEVDGTGALALLEAGFFERTHTLQFATLPKAFVAALLTNTPPQLRAIGGCVQGEDEARLKSAFGTRARVHQPYATPDPLAPTLRFALQQLDKVNGSDHAGEQGIGSMQQLWWEEDNLAHDAFHCGVSGVRWRPLRALDGLEAATKLETLFAPNSDIDALDPVAGAPLRTVSVANNRRLRSLVPLAGSTTLCELDISNTAVRDLSPLQSISTLMKLTAFGMALPDAQVALVAELRQRGVEVEVDQELSAKVDALAYPAQPGGGSDGASVLRDADLPALADEWDRHGPDSRGPDGLPVAQRAFNALRRDPEQRRTVVLQLVEAGADINAESFAQASTLLSKSIDDPALFQALLDLGADPNLPPASPPTEALVRYGRKPDADAVDRLIEAGAAMTPTGFEEAAGIGHLPLVTHALTQGLDPHADAVGRPIERAAASGSTAVVRAMLDAGAAPALALPYARTLEVYDQLVAAGASPTSRSVNGKTILDELASHRPDDAGYEDLITAAVRDGVPVTGDVLRSAVERSSYGGLPFFRALADAGVPLDMPWYDWNNKKNVHQARTLRDQRAYPELVAFAKERKIPTGASRIKAMVKPLTKQPGPLSPGHAMWRDILELVDLLPKQKPHQAPLNVVPSWVEAEAERARGDLDEQLRDALAPLAPSHPAVLLALAEGAGGTTPGGKGMLTLACDLPYNDRPRLNALLGALLDAGAPADVGHPLPLETYLQTASSNAVEVSSDLVTRLMHPQARTRSAFFWMANSASKGVDDREAMLAAFDDRDGVRFPLRDVALATYAELGDLERTTRAAEGQHWVTLTHALNQALQEDHLPVVDALLELGASPNFHVSGTNAALFWARSAGAVRRLAAAGARIHAGDSQRPAGSIIRFIGHEPHLTDVAQALLDAGASLWDVEPMTGQTFEAQLRALGRDDVDAWLEAKA